MRIKLEENEEFYTRKSCLKNKLKYPEFQEILDDYVIKVSKITHRGSLIVNRLLLHCLENNLEFPKFNSTFFTQCFTIGIADLRKPNELIQEVFDLYFQKFPLPARITADRQIITYQANKYMTNFKNHLKFNFEGIQKRLFKLIGNQCGWEKKDQWIVRYRINNWKMTVETPEDLEPLIKEFQDILGTQEINSSWLDKNPERLLKFYYEASKIFRLYNVRSLTMAPISRIKRHFIDIDTQALFQILSHHKFHKEKQAIFFENRDDHWNSFLEFDPGFNYHFETDGVSISIHYKRIKKTVTSGHPKCIIAIDPGRSNLIYATDGKKNWRLTPSSYYQSTGMTIANRRSELWNKPILKNIEDLSLNSPKDDFDIYIDSVVWNYDALWENYLPKKWARQRFRIYSRKNAVLDKFFSGMGRATIAYGAAKFDSTAKHEISAPTTYLSKKCSQHHKTFFVDEFNTSKKCHCCGEILSLVNKSIDGEIRMVRGLRWCGSTSCRKFINRDGNAALNILRAFKAGDSRPHYLQRNPRDSLCEGTRIKPAPIYIKDSPKTTG
jgi:hypothetical protein